MGKKILVLASNYGLWAEELQAPWDALIKAGHELTLATYKGMTPLPFALSLDPGFVDPTLKIPMNPPEVIDRVNRILDSGEWDHTIKISDADMNTYDALVIVGGPGAALDIVGNMFVHKLIFTAYKTHKIIGTLCYAVGALAFTRNPDNGNKSIIYGKSIVAHPHEWDFAVDIDYDVVRTTPENPGIKMRTCGFAFPLQYLIQDAVGPNGKVIADLKANRNNPCVYWDEPFVTAQSVESSFIFGQKMVEVLS